MCRRSLLRRACRQRPSRQSQRVIYLAIKCTLAAPVSRGCRGDEGAPCRSASTAMRTFSPTTSSRRCARRGLADARKDDGDARPRARGVRLRRRAHAAAVLSAALRSRCARCAGGAPGNRPADRLPAAVLLRVSRRSRAGAAICRAGNDALAAVVARAPDRFAVFATVPLQSPDGRGRRIAPRGERAGLLGCRDRLERRRRAAGRSRARRVLGRGAASSTCRCSCTRTTSSAASARRRTTSATCSATRRKPG